MYKKIILASLFAFGLSGIAFADADQGGMDFTSSADSTFNPGIYFGGQAGMSHMHYSGSAYTLPTNSVENKKFAARGYLGYAFSQYLSAEAGYDYFGRPKVKHDPSGNTQDFLQTGIDLVLKATLPLNAGFGFYVKGGGIWVSRSGLNSNGGFFASKESNSKIAPIGGFGLSYAFAPNTTVDLSWTKTMTMGDLPTIDFFALGLSYKLNI